MPSPPRDDLDSICLTCGEPNGPDRHFCSECGAPLTSHAVNDPFATIRAEGWVYRKAQNSPRSLIVVVGIWMIWGPIVIVGGIALIWGLFHVLWDWKPWFDFSERVLMFLSVVVIAALLWIPITVIRRTTTEYQRWKSLGSAGENRDDDEEEDREPLVRES